MVYPVAKQFSCPQASFACMSDGITQMTSRSAPFLESGWLKIDSEHRIDAADKLASCIIPASETCRIAPSDS